jgi:phosphopentomutase
MQKLNEHAIIIVLDSVGIGALPDAERFGDAGSDTLGNLARCFPEGLRLPHLEALGLGCIAPIKGIKAVAEPLGNYGKCAEQSPAKDTTLGHWEIAGLISPQPFPIYPNGFPPEIIEPFCKRIGIGILGNVPASGTEIIHQLGDEHVRTRKPIVYTSADSVFQIATHEEVYPVEDLYEMCQIARRLLTGKHRVARVIARPFIGESGSYVRTANRRDFSVSPLDETLLDFLKQAGYEVVGIGKIGDIFNGQGLTSDLHTSSNAEGIAQTIRMIKELREPGLIFTNLVDFDMLYGHRNNPQGYKEALEEFDASLPDILNVLADHDLLILTADHGCDPTTPSTDHSREYVPLLVYGKAVRSGVNLGTRRSFADIAKTIDQFFSLGKVRNGTSFLDSITREPTT